MNEADIVDHPAWPARALYLPVLGAALGLAFYFATDRPLGSGEIPQWGAAAGSAIAAGGVVFAFALERVRVGATALFALACAAVAASVAYWSSAGDGWNQGMAPHFLAGLAAIAIAVPLFQTARDTATWRLPYRPVHAHAWTNLVLGGASCVFVGATMILTLLLSELFSLIGIRLLHDLLEKGWLPLMLVAAAFGGAVAMLRDRDNVLRLLQRVVTVVLSVLAPPLALGLLLFVLALPFTGLGPLWAETKQTTPILLACVVGAAFLANAAIGNSREEEEARALPIRWGAVALAAVMLPLAAVAALSTAQRVGQYGWTPDRLWAAVLVGVALACGLAYLAALIRGRGGWAEPARRYNVFLATGICAVALFLALPILNFGAISAKSQVARLESGRVSPDRFDWGALRFDFGPSGAAAVKRLAEAGGSSAIRSFAAEALKADSRWAIDDPMNARHNREAAATLRVLPAPVPLPEDLRDTFELGFLCGEGRSCTLFFTPQASKAILVSSGACPRDKDGRPMSGPGHRLCGSQVDLAYKDGGTWSSFPSPPKQESDDAAIAAALKAGAVEIRQVTRRQVFVAGQPVGEAFE